MAGLTVTVYDHSYNVLGFVNNYATCTVEFRARDKAAGILVMAYHKADGTPEPMAMRVMSADTDVVPITVQVGARRWSGRVTHAVSAGASGAKVVTATMESDYGYLAAILAWPQPAFGIGAQIPSHDVKLGACETQVKSYIQTNAVNRLHLPVAVVPAPSPDPSAFVSMSARMTPIDKLVSASLQVANLGLSVAVWLPGDPQPPGLVLTTPTLVVDCIHPADKSFIVWDDRLGHVDTATTTVTATLSTTAITGGKFNSWLDTVFPSLPRDAFLAFDDITDVATQNRQGPFVYQETFTSAGAGAFSVDAGIAALTKLNSDKGKRVVVATVADGAPWTFGVDYNETDTVGVHVDGVDFRQTVTLVAVTDDRANGLRITPTVGDAATHEDPTVQLYNRINDLISNIQSLTLGA